MKIPFGHYGGKFYMANWIIENIPEHEVYIEPFCGAGSIFWNKPKSNIEVLNDLDEGIYIFFKVLRDNYNELYDLLVKTQYSRQLYYECHREWKNEKNEIKKAWMWYVTKKMAFNGIVNDIPTGWKFSIVKYIPKSFNNAIEDLKHFSNRLKNVYIENNDFIKVLKSWDSKDSFFYCDPPYIASTRVEKNAYFNEMSDQEHEELIDSLLNLKGKAILSGYQNDLYSRLELKGWRKKEKNFMCPSNKIKDGNKSKRIEFIWLCPRTVKDLEKYQLFGLV